MLVSPEFLNDYLVMMFILIVGGVLSALFIYDLLVLVLEAVNAQLKARKHHG